MVPSLAGGIQNKTTGINSSGGDMSKGSETDGRERQSFPKRKSGDHEEDEDS